VTLQIKRIYAANEESDGLCFRQAPVSPLLSTSSLPGQSIHRIGLTSEEQITEEVKELIRLVYEQNG